MFDFSSTLGSASNEPKGKPHLDDYRFNQRKVGASLFSLGIYQPNWERVKDTQIKSVGIFDSEYFEPEKWRPSYPYPPFQNMTDRDGFWATKILMRLNDEAIRAIVEEAKYPEPEATDYVTKTLIERRNKIGRYWFSRVNPLDDFQLTSHQGKTWIKFEDLMISSGLAQPGSAIYRYRVIHEKGYEMSPWQEISEKSAEVTTEVQQGMKPGKTYLLQLQTRRSSEDFWSPIVDVILQKKSEVEMVGIQRRYRS